MQLHATGVHVTELTGLQRHIVVHDARALGLKACRQVGQRTCVNQLAQRGGCGLGQAPNQVQEAQTIGTGALDQQVVHVVLFALALCIEVASDADNLARGLFNGDDVGQLNACGVTTVVHILKAGQVIVDLELQQEHLFLKT